MEAQNDSSSSNNEYHPMGVVGSTRAFAKLILLSAESFGTPEERAKLEHNMLVYKRALEIKQSKRTLEKQRAREDEIRAREVRERNLPVPHLVTTYGHSLSGILGAHNHF